MAETLNNQDEKAEGHRHHHHHHHSSSSGSTDGNSHSSHRHHHHHSSSGVKIVTGNRLRRLPWLEGIGLIVVCLIIFFVMVTCTKFV